MCSSEQTNRATPSPSRHPKRGEEYSADVRHVKTMSWWGSNEAPVAQTELQSLISTEAEESHGPGMSTKALVGVPLAYSNLQQIRNVMLLLRECLMLVQGITCVTSKSEQDKCTCLQVSVKGMHCSSCSSAVERALNAQPGVQTANVALLKEQAEVREANPEDELIQYMALSTTQTEPQDALWAHLTGRNVSCLLKVALAYAGHFQQE